ncbi:Phosphoribosylaminoimidazole carboxylase ATPase subunit [Geitlerinema sp. FC II]|nr:Phosphoribosylaminoimidazole carboxylase ATPase subunit [Geitlerinema sp. FC II]
MGYYRVTHRFYSEQSTVNSQQWRQFRVDSFSPSPFLPLSPSPPLPLSLSPLLFTKTTMNSDRTPRRRVGIIGGGQLAWMMAREAPSLGLEVVVQTPKLDDPAVELAAETVLAEVADARATFQLAERCDVITFENEFVALEELAKLAEKGVCFRPRLEALEPLLDKYHQRCRLREWGLPVPQFVNLAPQETIPIDLGFPLVMKARRHGYDGQGTVIVETGDALNAVWQRWGYPSVLLEEFVRFDRELAVIAARSATGEIAIYPVVETQQENQVCRRVLAPAMVSPAVVFQCEAIARRILEKLDVVGLFGIELFLTPDEKVLVNEIAPRTHNSGHFSLDACDTSQFAQLLRAVCDLPLGSTAMKSPAAVMVNLLGYETARRDYRDKREAIAALPHTFVYWYGKTESRPGRKLGHATALVSDPSQGTAIARDIEAIWYGR